MKKTAFLIVLLFVFSFLLSKNYNYLNDSRENTNFDRADSLHGFDVLHYDLEIDISMNDSIYGVMTMDAVTNADLSLVELELEQLNVIDVKVDNVTATFNFDSHVISIPVSISNGSNFSVEITYNGTPVMSNDGYNLGLTISNTYAYTMSDPSGVRWWMPAYDHPWDKATIDYHVKIRDDWLVACNGLRTGIEDVTTENKRIHHWSSSDPVALHVACITAADFNELSNTHNGLPIQNFVTDNILTEATHDFADMPFMIDTYSDYYGAYPFEKYGNTVVPIQTFGAMEHQTMTTLGINVIDGQSGGEHTIAHELSHQWFGNSLTPLTWKDVWLSEGFAVLSEAVYDEARYGHESMLDYIEDNIHNVYKQWTNSNGPRIIYDPVYSEFFAPPSYEKAASVLLALRAWVGEDSFKHILQTWFNEYSNQNVITQEFIDLVKRETSVVESDVDEFFNQWIFSDGLPSFKYIVLYNYDTDEIMPVIKTESTTQTQFNIFLPLHVHNTDSSVDTIIVKAVPDIPDNPQTFSMSNVALLSVLDEENLVINTGKRSYEITLNNVYASNNAVMIDWNDQLDMFEIDGYNVYRRSDTETEFVLMNDLPVTESYYIDSEAVSGTEYEYMIAAVKNGFYGAYSNIMSAAPVNFTMDQGILIVDETIDIDNVPGFPSDSACDYFYDRIIDSGITELDYNGGDSLSLDILGQYSTVIVHDDESAMKKIDEYQILLAGYVAGGGNLIISGWETVDYIDRNIYSLLGISENIELNLSRDFSYAANGSYNLTLDPSKLDPSWNNLLNNTIIFNDETESDGLVRLKFHGDNSEYENEYVVFHKEYDLGNHIILFGFPLYYTTPDGTNEYMDYILNYLGEEVSVKELENPEIKGLDFYVSGNPVSGNQVKFSMKNIEASRAELKIYNIKGQQVYSRIMDCETGNTLVWDMKDKRSKSVSSGVYFAKLKSGKSEKVRKFVIMK